MASAAFLCPRLARYAYRCLRYDHGMQASRPCRSYCSNPQFEQPDIRKLAEMAQIHVTDEEVEEWTPQLLKVTKFFAQLQAIDLTDVPPTLRVTEEDSEMPPREDLAESHPMSADFLESVPARDGDFIKVPPIQGGQ
eukprot:jgi/Ulvmu1/2710/UM014_0166.1